MFSDLSLINQFNYIPFGRLEFNRRGMVSEEVFLSVPSRLRHPLPTLLSPPSDGPTLEPPSVGVSHTLSSHPFNTSGNSGSQQSTTKTCDAVEEGTRRDRPLGSKGGLTDGTGRE